MEKIYRVQMNSKGMPNFSTAEEVPSGEWIPYEASLNFGDGEGYVIEHKCSACGYLWGEPDYKFCPNCGARMKGAGDE